MPIDDIDAIAQAVRRLLKDGHLRERLVANAYVHYLSDFTQSAVADSYLQFYQDIIELQPQIFQEMADAEQQLTRREKWRKRLNWLLRAGCW